jgi:hypothetical protein
LISKDFGEGAKVIFVVDDAIDSIGKVIRVQAPESMASYFSFELTPPDPDEPDPAVNCALTTLLEAVPPTAVLDTVLNQWILRLVPLSSSMTFEFATELNGITKAGAEITSIAYYQVAKNSDGSYSVRIANTGAAETVLIRQKGCTSTIISPGANDFNGGRFHAYNPSYGGGEIPTPIEGKVNVPVIAWRWDGFYDDYGLSPRQGIDGHTYDQGINQSSGCRLQLTEFSSANVVPFYGEQGLANENIPIITEVVWNPTTEVNDLTIVYRDVTCKFNQNQVAVDKEIGFALDAGIDCFSYLWYSPYDSPMAEAMVKFVASGNKSTMKMCLAVGSSIGWDTTKNINYMTDRMNSDYYLKIDGKPVVFCELVCPHLAAIKASYSAKTSGGELYIIAYTLHNEYPYFDGANGSSVYYTEPARLDSDGALTELPHSRTVALEKEKWEGHTTGDIIPCLTTGARKYNERFSLHPNPRPYWSGIASSTDWDTKFTNIINFVEANPFKCKAIVIYSWNENAESGNPICPTLTSGTTSVTVSSLNVSGANTGVNRATLDKVKQYCKK